MGSVLSKNGRDFWNISKTSLYDYLKTRGDSLLQLKLDLNNDNDGVSATSLMHDHVIPGFARVDGYNKLVKRLKDEFNLTVGSINDEKPANFFEFPYDWRRDNRQTASKLKALIDRALATWREDRELPDAKVILIAHSMGGLVSRYYLEVLGGWQNCRALITFGTPFRGSVDILEGLHSGVHKAMSDLTDVVRGLPSAYQLLPIFEMVRHEDRFRRVAELEWGGKLDPHLTSDALQFHREIEAKVDENRQRAEYQNQGYKVIPFVGIGQPTKLSADYQKDTLKISNERPHWIDDESLSDGDGTVPRLSAIPIEYSNELRETYLIERHGSLQNNDQLLADVVERIRRMQSDKLKAIRGEIGLNAKNGISLELPPLFVNEPVCFTATVAGVAHVPKALTVRVSNAVTNEVVVEDAHMVRSGDKFELRDLILGQGRFRLLIEADALDDIPSICELTEVV
ncbi:MAG: lecithin--cholesterol acyltransferase [Cyanobacteria bacterium PR.3.49]|nr:lecithin--cholesterol acyltransferase [Cyanobacteria bacterium PR.3.49]